MDSDNLYAIRVAIRALLVTLALSSTALMAESMSTTDPTITDALAAPGKFVTANGRQIHYICTGPQHSRSTVILESGLGGSCMDWSSTQPLLATFTRVCSYDRAGYGFSDPVMAPRTSDNIANELAQWLKAAEIPPPYVLLGHSFGGFIARTFADNNPHNTAAVMLIDASHEQQFEIFKQRAGINLAPSPNSKIRLSPPTLPNGIKKHHQQLALHMLSTAAAMHTQVQELRLFSTSAKLLATRNSTLNLPLTVMSHGVSPWGNNAKSKLKEQIWQELQIQMLSLSDNAKQVVATNSGHYIHLDEPQLVATEVAAIIERSTRWRAIQYAEEGDW